MKFRKKPIVIDAVRTWKEQTIETLEGNMVAQPGDWIITGIAGERYPCKDDIFQMTYEPMEDEEQNPATKMIKDMGGDPSDVTVLPDGSAFCTASFPLPKDHWIYDNCYFVPLGLRCGTANPMRKILSEHLREAGKSAIRAATMNGTEMDFDPDALLQNLEVALLGNFTEDGLNDDEIHSFPDPIPPEVVAIIRSSDVSEDGDE